MQNSETQVKKKVEKDLNRFKPVFTWDKDRVSLVQKDEIDLKESMKEKARGCSIYEMLEKYGSFDLIPGANDRSAYTTGRVDGKLTNAADVDLTGLPEFSTDVSNEELRLAEELYNSEKKKAEDAAKAAAEAKAKEAEAKKARDEAINKILAKEGGNQ